MAVENPDDPNLRPASFLQDSVLLTAKDPSASVPGMPINYGRYPLVHSASFQAYMSTGTGKVYREYDEAVKASLDNARYMRNDCGIMECLEARQRMVSLLDWHLEPEDEKDAQQKEWCAKLTAMIQRIHRFTEYRRCLMEAIWYGKHGVQNRYGWVNIGGCQYQIPKPRHKDDLGWRPINGDKLVFRQDRLDLPEEAYAGQLGIRVGNNWQLGQMVANTWKIEQVDRGMAYFLRPWERDLLCVHRHMIEDAAYEDALDAGTINGVGIRSRIYWEWVQKQESLGFLMDYLERSAGGIELWSYPQGNAQAKAEVETAAKNRARGQNVMLVPIPMGEDSGQYGVNIIEPGMQGIETVHNLVSDYYGHRIKRYILGQTLSSEADATGMGSGVADLHLDTLMQIIKYDARGLEETLTYQLVDMLQRLNLPESVGTMIRFKLDVESPDVEKKLEAYARAYEMGARIGERDVLNLIGASVPGPDDRVLMKPEQQQPGGDGMGGMGGGAMGDGSGASDDRLAGQLQQEFHHQQEQMQAAGGAGSGVRSGGSGDTDGDGDTDSDDGGSGKKQPGGGGKGGPLKYSRDWSETEHPRDPDNGQFVGDDDDEKNEDSDDSGEGSSGDEKPAISRRGNMDFEDAKIALLAHPDGQILFQSAIKNGEIAGKMAGDEQRQSLTRIVNLMLSKLDKKTKLAYRSVMRHFEGHRLDDQIADEDPELFDELQADGTDKYARDEGKSRWITLNGGHGEGTHVLVDSAGNIKGGPDSLTGKNLDLLTRDMLDDQDNFDTKTGWHSNYEAVPVQPSKEESAAKDKETRQKSSHDAIKQIERDLWGLETSESGPSGDISHLVDFGRQPMGGSKGQIGIRGDSAYYYHPGSYDDYRPVFKVSSDPEMVASVKSAIEDAFSSHGHSSPAGLSFSGSAIPEKPKPQPKPEPKPELPPKRETAATPAEKKPEPVPAAPKTDSLVSRKVADGDPVRAGGKTFNNKDELKSLGARWDGQNKEWVFHVADMSQSQRDALERKMDRLKSRGVTFYSRGKSLFAIDSQDEQQKFSRRLTSLMDDAITRYYRSDSDGSISHPDDHGVTFAEAPAHSPASHPPAKNKPGWQHVGGSSVFVNADGKITKGCPGLKGEHVSDLIDESDESRDERDARQAHAKARGLTGKDLTGTEAKRLGTKKLQAQHQAAKQAAKSSGIGTHHVLRNLPEAQQRLAATGDQFEPARARARQLTGHNTRTLGAVENRGGGDANSVANLDTIGQQLAEEFPELGWDVNDSNGDKVFDLIRQGKSADRFAPHSPEVAAHAAELARQDKAAARQTQKPQPQRAPLADPIAETMQQMFDSYSSGDDWQQGAGDEPYEPEDEWSMGEQFQQRQRQNQRQEADAVPF